MHKEASNLFHNCHLSVPGITLKEVQALLVILNEVKDLNPRCFAPLSMTRSLRCFSR